MSDRFFVCYSSSDRAWTELLFRQGVETTVGTLFRWQDCEHLTPGTPVLRSIETEIARARTVVLLVSRHFLNTEFIQDHEWGWIEAYQKRICWVQLGRTIARNDSKLSEPARRILATLRATSIGCELPSRVPPANREIERTRAVRAVHDAIRRVVDPEGAALQRKLERQVRARRAEAIGAANLPDAEVEPTVSLERIGIGELSKAYRFRGPALGRSLVAKVARTGDDTVKQAFDRTPELAEDLVGVPSVIPVYQIDRQDDPPHMVVDFVEGGDLLRWLEARQEQGQRMGAGHAQHILAKLALALKSIGESPRDRYLSLRPSNVLVDDRFDPPEPLLMPACRQSGALATNVTREQILSSGIAVRLRMEALTYRLPEQVDGQNWDSTRADIYLLGLLGYQLLSGDLPPTILNRDAVEAAMLASEQPVHPEYRTDPLPDIAIATTDCSYMMSQLIMQMVSRDPDQRPATIDQVVAGLLRTPPPALVTVENSWRRCLDRGAESFFHTFYDHLFRVAGTRDAFGLAPGEAWPSERQRNLLQSAVLHMMEFYDRDFRYGRVPDALNPLHGTARQHANYAQVQAPWFAEFTRAILRSVAETDPSLADHPAPERSEIWTAWDTVLRPATSYMRDVFESARSEPARTAPPRAAFGTTSGTDPEAAVPE